MTGERHPPSAGDDEVVTGRSYGEMTAVDPTILTDAELAAELDRLRDAERGVSTRRTKLHDRLSFLGAGDARVPTLREEERVLSEERQALHLAIDLHRAELTRRGIR